MNNSRNCNPLDRISAICASENGTDVVMGADCGNFRGRRVASGFVGPIGRKAESAKHRWHNGCGKNVYLVTISGR